MIISLSGCAVDADGQTCSMGAGKDAVADILVKNHRFVKIGFADPLKRFLKEVYDFSDEQLWGDSEHRNAPDTRYVRPRKIDQTEDVYLTPRHALQTLGTDWGRDTCCVDTWLNVAVRTAHKLLNNGNLRYDLKRGLYEVEWSEGTVNGVVISDTRFINEMESLRASGAKTVRIVRPVNTVINAQTTAHASERELLSVDDREFDYALRNDGDLETLACRVAEMLAAFR